MVDYPMTHMTKLLHYWPLLPHKEVHESVFETHCYGYCTVKVPVLSGKRDTRLYRETPNNTVAAYEVVEVRLWPITFTTDTGEYQQYVGYNPQVPCIYHTKIELRYPWLRGQNHVPQ
jgi:hypothetical protein